MAERKNKYVKSVTYVKWLSEGGEKCCNECKSKNGCIYTVEETAKFLPVHPNCKCKAVDTVSVRTELLSPKTLISSLAEKYALGSEKAQKDILRLAEKYANPDKKLPQKEGRSYYRITFGEGEHLVFSSDGMSFVTYNNFETVYPVENIRQAEKHKKDREAEFFDEFEKETEIFAENKMAPAAYSYIMKNIYDWYASDSAAERAEIESKLRRFRKANYEYTGDEETDRLIEKMDKRPDGYINMETHYFRNKLNIEFDWETFRKIQERVPEKYRWEQMIFPFDLMHQNTSKYRVIFDNRKYVSFDGYFEAVYSHDNKLLNEETAPTDMGTYNYAPSTAKEWNAWYDHYMRDVQPYKVLKNTFDDAINSRKKWRSIGL